MALYKNTYNQKISKILFKVDIQMEMFEVKAELERTAKVLADFRGSL
ncbi:hypothetical protein KP78_14230 [Jeotgalibacillus soli]|uniref:Uncharacterized protein n=1 Tax=Jeotgalibacillus soli TaxID=889306 RepID=A0A0C2RIH2_9BACL|nr:hypothetical protein KP78_14230 [Jeotgalibacillus soli]